MKILILFPYFIALGITYHAAEAGVTVLVEKATLNKTAPLPPPPLPISAVKELSKLAIVTQPAPAEADHILLTRDKELKSSIWRTDAGDLVNLTPVKGVSHPVASLENQKQVPIMLNDALVDGTSSSSSSSTRTMRTFWPFTSLFGYDYPPPMYGPIMPMGMASPAFGYGGMGMGMLAPPPPLLGMGFGGRW